MKAKYLIVPALLSVLLCACYDGPVGERSDYMVSGHVYYPDGTPFNKMWVSVLDYQYYAISPGGAHLSEREYGGMTNENGYFEISISQGGMHAVTIDASYLPECDTAILDYFYIVEDTFIRYTNKHCFENLELFAERKIKSKVYPYFIPSYPIIGDSVRVVMTTPITKINLCEEGIKNVIFSMEYQQPDTSVMFYIPESVSLEKDYSADIYGEDGSRSITWLHLREHEGNN